MITLAKTIVICITIIVVIALLMKGGEMED